MKALAIIAALAAAALASGVLRAPQARVVCLDSGDARLSADMDMTDVTQTPAGWVLHFPHRADPARRVEVWDMCEVSQ